VERLKIAVEAGVAGILSLLWWDVRKVRFLKDRIVSELRAETAENYLTKDKHEDICKIACLEMKNYVRDTVSNSEQRIIQAVKQSNGGHS